MPVMPGAEPFRHDGGGVGVLLVHGFTGTPQSMRAWGEHLADAGFTVDCPRLPGHGTTWPEMNRTRWPDWYGQVERSFDELRRRCAAVFVFGLSMGGTLTLRLAEERGDDVAGIAVVNASLLSLDPRRHVLPVLQHVLASLPGIASDIKAPGVVELAYDRAPLKAAASLQQFWPLVLADLGRVTAPALVFHSPADHVVPPASHAALMAAIGSSDVREVLLPDSYHVATLDNDRETIFTESVAFISSHVPVEA